jgi:NADH-ubiquinone oxidoreductase chain 3
MSSTTFFFLFIPLLAIILLAVNLIFAPHNPYQEKNSAFECGFHSFLGQNRTQFSISFFIFALLFLLFDLEILLVYPYVVSAYTNGIYGLVIMLIFFLALTLGFAFELGKNALKIDSRQMISFYSKKDKSLFSVLSTFSLFKNFKPKLASVITKDNITTSIMVLVGALLGRVMLSVGYIPTNINEFIFALIEPLNISGGLLLSLLSLHINWICNGFKLNVSSLLCNIFIICLFFFFKVGVLAVLINPAKYIELLGLSGFFENIFKIPACIRTIYLRIRVIFASVLPLVYTMDGSTGGGGGTAGATGSGGGTVGTAGAGIGRSGAASMSLRGLGFTDSGYPGLFSPWINEILAKNGLTNIFGANGKLNTIEKVKLFETQLRALKILESSLQEDFHSLSHEQKASHLKIKQAIANHYYIIAAEKLDGANSLLSLRASDVASNSTDLANKSNNNNNNNN